MAVKTHHSSAAIDLGPFRRRILLLRAWRLAAVGGTVGALLTILALIGDRIGYWDAPVRLLIALTLGGFAVGIAASLLERYTDAQIAKSIDRRSALDERLTTIYESAAAPLDDSSESYIAAVRTDASHRIVDLSARRLYPLSFQRPQIICLVLLAICGIVYLAVDTTLLKPLQSRIEARELATQAVTVEQIARPIIEEAKKPTATPDEKQLARSLDKFANDLKKGRMDKQEALIRANQLAQQAQQIEAKRNLNVAQSLDKAQSAGAKLQEMADQAKMQKSNAAQLADQASALQRQMSTLQQQIDAAKAGKSNLTPAQQAALERKLAQLQKEFHQVQLSQQALDMLNKLTSMPQFKQAMDLLSKLQQQQQALQNGEAPPLTDEQAKAMAEQLEQLAKELNSDAKMRAYAEALLQAAMQAQMNLRDMQLSQQLMGAFGQPQQPRFGMGGRGGTDPGVWVGGVGHLHHFDKSSLLHVKFQDRIITSQKGKTGPETYTEEMGPSQMGDKSGIPYQNVLPKYEKTAESALSKGDIPPAMRTRVRDYFDSLHQGQ